MGDEAVEEIEHTADWAIRVQAENLAGLFERAAVGMFALIGEVQASPEISYRPITLQAADEETLLVIWLEELLYILEAEDLVAADLDVQILNSTQLLANVGFVPAGERPKEIKAVTYHDLSVQQTPQGYQVTIVFDV